MLVSLTLNTCVTDFSYLCHWLDTEAPSFGHWSLIFTGVGDFRFCCYEFGILVSLTSDTGVTDFRYWNHRLAPEIDCDNTCITLTQLPKLNVDN